MHKISKKISLSYLISGNYRFYVYKHDSYFGTNKVITIDSECTRSIPSLFFKVKRILISPKKYAKNRRKK